MHERTEIVVHYFEHQADKVNDLLFNHGVIKYRARTFSVLNTEIRRLGGLAEQLSKLGDLRQFTPECWVLS